MENICAEKKISITIKNHEKIFVKADKKKIEQVITNIFNNAVDFISGENRIEITTEESDSRVKVEIFNTGNPLSEVGLNKVWNRFYKEDKARKRSLGCHKYIRPSQLRIWCKKHV